MDRWEEKKSKKKCFYCDQVGHVIRDYQKKKDDLRWGKSSEMNLVEEDEETPKGYGLMVVIKDPESQSCASSGCNSESMVQFDVEKEPEETVDTCWYVDLGGDIPHDIRKRWIQSGRGWITVGDRGRADVAGSVGVWLGGGRELIIQEVLHMPNLSKNLISIGCLTYKGLEVSFKRQGYVISDEEEDVIAIGFRMGSSNLYQLQGGTVKRSAAYISLESKTKNNLWHRRMRHLGGRNL
ncbi:hypothetical protein O6H91_03G066800 [Diphasiastrum complanatum]|uniref:Uncharacterized protein n=1 Tax=Diphasiastrum complanatum TaxID=34168 RepID=A0ACC2E7J6_DIPCM|nr:hypothetical protein O6H91_03G066800 [Diphasiastrum complanatum]